MEHLVLGYSLQPLLFFVSPHFSHDLVMIPGIDVPCINQEMAGL